ncbi:DMT family transporter [Histidinibacterium lentulum]|uniref:DMT family transporter n=1 Tax=Histidinibacterium lentulum TaxID=2480588 RepID=A0A3N2R158_9RHOB|nr:DMT family transporter [Histidinibacterium lentulum]ROU01205.1 DMT family transporter [Histidinibacterium lentulum]
MSRTAPDPPRAIALMIAATACLAGTTLMAKALGTGALGPPLHPLQVTHGRFLFALVAFATTAAILRPRLTLPNVPRHLGRTLCGVAGVTLLFAAAARMPLSDATAISFLNPVFGMMLAIPLLGERVGPVRWLAAAIALSGAVILLRPGSSGLEVAALLALGAALALGAELIFIKRLADSEPPLQILLVNNMLGWLIAGTAMVPFWEPPTPAQWAGLAALGLLMAAAQACFVNAMARAEASLVTPFSYLTLLFAALCDAALFGILPDTVSLIGAATIVAGAALLAWREIAVHRRPRPPVLPSAGAD